MSRQRRKTNTQHSKQMRNNIYSVPISCLFFYVTLSPFVCLCISNFVIIFASVLHFIRCWFFVVYRRLKKAIFLLLCVPTTITAHSSNPSKLCNQMSIQWACPYLNYCNGRRNKEGTAECVSVDTEKKRTAHISNSALLWAMAFKAFIIQCDECK